MFKNIIWATDGSEHADRALDYALKLAQSENAKLHVVHIVERLSGQRAMGETVLANEQEIEAKTRGQVARLKADSGIDAQLRLESSVRESVVQGIADVADDVHADLIVVGTRGHSAVAGALLGSVTQRLLHVASCPVLAVPPLDHVTSSAKPDAETTAAR